MQSTFPRKPSDLPGGPSQHKKTWQNKPLIITTKQKSELQTFPINVSRLNMDSVPHVCACHMCGEVRWSHHIVWNLNSRLSMIQENLEWEQCGRRCVQREGMRHWISAWDAVPASSYFWACWDASRRARHSLLAFPPPSLPHEPAKPYLPTRMKKEKKTHALLFLLMLHFTSGKALLFFYCLCCVWLRLLASHLSG